MALLRTVLLLSTSVCLFWLFPGISYAGENPAPPPASTFKPDFKLEGQGFLVYTHDMSKGDGQSNNFEVQRMYFGIKYFAAENLTFRYLTDITGEGGTGKLDAYAKYAYADLKLNGRMNLIMGLQGTYNWKPAEDAWGYRVISSAPMESFGDYWGVWSKSYIHYLETWAETDPAKTADAANFATASRSKMGSSADMGVAVSCKPVKTAYVNFMIRNGSGYKKAEDDMFKNFQLLVGNYFLDKALNVSAF